MCDLPAVLTNLLHCHWLECSHDKSTHTMQCSTHLMTYAWGLMRRVEWTGCVADWG